MKMKRISLVLILMVSALLAVPAWTGAADAITATVDGKAVKWPSAPVKAGSTMLVDAKMLLQLIGASYNYEKGKKKLTAKMGEKTLVLTAGSKNATLDGNPYSLSAAPAASKNGINVPADSVTKAFGGYTQWAGSSKYDIMSAKKWRAAVSAQLVPVLRKLTDAREKKNEGAIAALVNPDDQELLDWAKDESAPNEDYSFDLNLTSANVADSGPDYVMVHGVVSYSLADGLYFLDYEVPGDYYFAKIGTQWKLTGFAFAQPVYLIPDEPVGAQAVREKTDAYVKSYIKVLNNEDAQAYSELVVSSMAEEELNRMTSFFAEQEQQIADYNYDIVHIDENGAVYIVLYQTISAQINSGEEIWDSVTLVKLDPQDNGSLLRSEEISLLFEKQEG